MAIDETFEDQRVTGRQNLTDLALMCAFY